MRYDDTALSAAHAEVKAEIARTDNKASLLLAFNGALLAGTWSVASERPLPRVALGVGIVGVFLLIIAAAVLLSTVRPNLSGRAGFPLWATLTAEQLRSHLHEDRLADDIAGLSRLAVAKFSRLSYAIDLTRAAGVLLGLAAVTAIGGAL